MKKWTRYVARFRMERRSTSDLKMPGRKARAVLFLLLRSCRFDSEDSQLSIAGDKNLAIRHQRNQIGVATDVCPCTSADLRERLHGVLRDVLGIKCVEVDGIAGGTRRSGNRPDDRVRGSIGRDGTEESRIL